VTQKKKEEKEEEEFIPIEGRTSGTPILSAEA
jgi:hypothetical protein